MPADYTGYWKMIVNDNFEEYLKALGEFRNGVGLCPSLAQRKILGCLGTFLKVVYFHPLKEAHCKIVIYTPNAS